MVRIHGIMNKLQLPKIDIETMESIKKDILDSNQQKAFEDKLEIDLSYSLKDLGRFRVNFFKQINGLSAVFRTIPSSIKSSEELGIAPIVNQLALKEKGLVLLTGPTLMTTGGGGLVPRWKGRQPAVRGQPAGRARGRSASRPCT